MPDITPDEALRQLDQMPPTEDYAPPSPKQAAKAKAVGAPSSLYDKPPVPDQQAPLDKAKQYLREEGKGVVQGVSDPYYGGKQRLIHAFGNKAQAADVDQEVRDREKEYQKATPHSLGIGRLIGGIGPAAITAPVSGLAAGAIGLAEALMAPVTDTTTKSYTKQSIENAALGVVAAEVPGAASALTKNSLRGGVAAGMVPAPVRAPVAASMGLKTPGEYGSQMAGNIATMRRAGVQKPTLGQVSEGGLSYGAGAGERIKEVQTAQVTKKAENLRDNISPIHTVKEAGDSVTEGINTWEKNFREKENKLYDKFYARLPAGTSSPLDHTLKILETMTTPSAKAQATSAKFVSRDLLDIQSRLHDDLINNGGKLPYEDIKQLRTRISELVNWNRPDQPINKTELIKLRTALSQDMEDMVKGSKSKTAYKLWKDANDYTSENLTLKEDFLDPIRGGKTPGEVYANVLKGSSTDSTRLEKVLGSVDRFTGNRIKSTFMNEMGRSGEKFDIFKFAKSWDQLEGGLKTAMFGKDGSSLRTSLGKIAEIAVSVSPKLDRGTITDIRKYAVEHGAEGELATLALAARHFGTAKILFTGLVGGFALGRHLQNPTFLNWLARSSNRPPASLPIILSNLVMIKKSLPKEDQKDVDDYLRNLRNLVK